MKFFARPRTLVLDLHDHVKFMSHLGAQGPVHSPDQVNLLFQKYLKMSSLTEVNVVKDEEIRSKSHEFKLNVEKQINRNIEDAHKEVLKVKNNEEEIKIRPNSGNIKVIAEEVLKLKVGHEFKNEEAIATVKDVHQQTDSKNIPFMVKTEFSVTDVKAKISEKAVLHTYITKTF